MARVAASAASRGGFDFGQTRGALRGERGLRRLHARALPDQEEGEGRGDQQRDDDGGHRRIGLPGAGTARH